MQWSTKTKKMQFLLGKGFFEREMMENNGVVNVTKVHYMYTSTYMCV